MAGFALTEEKLSVCYRYIPPVASVAGREAASGRLLHVRMEAAKMTRKYIPVEEAAQRWMAS
jgi:hypothetical protein